MASGAASAGALGLLAACGGSASVATTASSAASAAVLANSTAPATSAVATSSSAATASSALPSQTTSVAISASAAPAAQQASVSGSKITLRYMYDTPPGEKVWHAKVKTDYEQLNPNITLQPEVLGADWVNKASELSPA